MAAKLRGIDSHVSLHIHSAQGLAADHRYRVEEEAVLFQAPGKVIRSSEHSQCSLTT